MSKLKKIIGIFCVMLFSTSALAGCALFERDVKHYNSRVVATVGSNITINKKQLIDGFNQVGFRFMQQQGMTHAEALDETLALLINREILTHLSIDMFSLAGLNDTQKAAQRTAWNNDPNWSIYYLALNGFEQAEVRKTVYDRMDAHMAEMETRIRAERRLTATTNDPIPTPESHSQTHETFRDHNPLISRANPNGAFDNMVFRFDYAAFAQTDNLFFVDREWEEGDQVGNPTRGVFLKNEGFGDTLNPNYQPKFISTVPEQWEVKYRGNDFSQTEAKITDDARQRLARLLRNNEKGLGFTGAADTDMAVIQREIDRMIEDVSKAKLVERFQSTFDQGISAPINRESQEFRQLVNQRQLIGTHDSETSAYLWALRATQLGLACASCVVSQDNPTCAGCKHCDIQLINCEDCGLNPVQLLVKNNARPVGERRDLNLSATSDALAKSMADDAREYYNEQVRMQYDRYIKGLSTDASIASRLLENLDGLYFVPRTVADRFFTVSHILIGFSDDEQEILNQLKADLQAGRIDETAFNIELTNLQEGLRIQERDKDGNEIGLINARDVYNEVLKHVRPIGSPTGTAINQSSYQADNRHNNTAELQGIISRFHECIYRFNSDPGMRNAEFEYIVGLDQSRMVTPFTEDSRRLFGYNTVIETGPDGRPVKVLGDRGSFAMGGKKGSMSTGLVWTDFGAHIIMYTRNIRDFIVTRDVNEFLPNPSVLIEEHLFSTLNSYGNTLTPKTHFDKIVTDQLSRPNYATFERSLLAREKSDMKIRINKAQFKDLISN
jgi:hypothetical protein